MAKRIDAKQWDRAKELLGHFEKINAHALRTVASRVGISYTSTRYIASGQLKRPAGAASPALMPKPKPHSSPKQPQAAAAKAAS